MMEPYYQDQTVELFHARAEEVLPTLEPQSIDLILTDPPYFRFKDTWWDRQWKNADAYLEWMRSLCVEWQRVLKPNGSLYVFASPGMATPVEMVIRKRFQVLNTITWSKPPYSTKAEMFVKEDLRLYFPASERIIFAEHRNSDSMALGTSGYAAQCEILRGFVFESIRAYLDGERQRAGISKIAINEACGFSPTPGGMASRHYFSSSQWQLPTKDHYSIMQALFNEKGTYPAPPFSNYHPKQSSFSRVYNNGHATEYLRTEYEELRTEYEYLRTEYEELRRPFTLTARGQYTDVWTFPTVPAGVGKHPCEKPLSLLEHAIRVSSKPGGVILDCFSGSGATLEACKRLGRKGIGIEVEEHWCRQSTRRLRQEVLPLGVTE